MKRNADLLRPANLVEWILYASRWLLVPMYLGLALALVVYAVRFLLTLWGLVQVTLTDPEEEIMLKVLDLVDITMVANLILMILIGGYTIFVQRMHFKEDSERPGWLHGISSGTLKVKMGLSLLGVTAVQLLRDFVQAEQQTWDTLCKRMAVHGLFMLTCLAMVVTYRLLTHHHHEPAKPHGGDHARADRPLPAGGQSRDDVIHAHRGDDRHDDDDHE